MLVRKRDRFLELYLNVLEYEALERKVKKISLAREDFICNAIKGIQIKETLAQTCPTSSDRSDISTLMLTKFL